MQTDNALAALETVYGLMIEVRAVSSHIQQMDDDIKAARESGLLSPDDERFLAPHTCACKAIARAKTEIAKVLKTCDLQPELLDAPQHLESLAIAQRSLTLALVLVGNAQEYTDSMGPEDHL